MKTIYKKLLFILLLLPLGSFAQGTLEGVVLDSKTNQPIPAANVVVQGASTSASTDLDGKFKLAKLKNGDKINVSFIGYKSKTVTYSGQSSIKIMLEEESNQIQEVVVQVGYGSVKKKDATGSVDIVSSKEFNKGAIVTADQLLTGKAAGVRITNNGGQPDSAPNIRIRGGGSLSSSNNPLIVIDGIPIASDNPAGVSNPLSLVNPNDVESFSILKDASATAIYGSRASNGVIIITTKKGVSKGVKFNYSANVTAGKVGKTIDVMDGPTFTKFIQEYHPTLTNLLGVDDPATTLTDDLATPQIEGRILSNTNWQDAIFRTSISTDHNFSARANLYGKIPFRASLGYNKTEGLVRTSDLERLSYSLKLTPSLLNNHLKIDMNAKGMLTDKNTIDEGGALNGVVNMDPTKPIYDNSSTNIFGGYYQDTFLNSGRNQINGQSNPLALLEQRSRPERSLRFLGNIEFDYKMHFLPELRAVVNLGIDASQSRIRESYTDNALATYRFNQGADPSTNFVFNPGLNYLENQTVTNNTLDSYLIYTKQLGKFIEKFDLQAGYVYQNFKNDGNKINYQYNINTGLREEQLNANNPNNRYYNVMNLQSFFGRSNIDINKKYLLTLSMRTDGSSLFKEENRWGYFPAAALAWKLKEESFMKNSKTINDLKLRLGWGKTGQQDITSVVGTFYPASPFFILGSNTSQYLQGLNLYSALPFNGDLTWERTTTENIGLDFDLFKNNFITGSLDFYRRFSDRNLYQTPLPPGQGLTNQFVQNIAEVEGKGFELNLNLNLLKTQNTSLEFNSNLTYNYIEVQDISGLTLLAAGGSIPTGTGVGIAYNGLNFQPGSAWMFQQLYDTDKNPIPGAFVDRNDDGVINNGDRYFIPIVPNWTFGFGLNFNYKNWDFSSSFRGQLGGQVYNARLLSNGWTDRARPQNNNSLTNVLDFYNGSANPDYLNFNGNNAFSDYFLEDATFLRCENIVLGYKFNKFYKSSSLRVYGALNNAFILTKYSGQDPENFGGIDNNFYPRPKMYTFGLSLDF